MILRYYEVDWSVPCVENELLFTGTKEECVKYIFRNWSVDVKEYEDNPELCATFRDYLRHIQVGETRCPAVYSNEVIKELWENNNPAWCEHIDWKNIDAQKFIFNRDLVEVV